MTKTMKMTHYAMIWMLAPALLMADVMIDKPEPTRAQPVVNSGPTMELIPVEMDGQMDRQITKRSYKNETPQTLRSEKTPITTPIDSSAGYAPVGNTQLVQLRLSPSTNSPIIMTVPQASLTGTQTGIAQNGVQWMSVEQNVTLTGWVDKKAINKNLEVKRGTVVWSDENKTEELTTVDDPSAVRVRSVERMGQVQVKESRVLYYSTTQKAQGEWSTNQARRGTTVKSPQERNVNAQKENVRVIEGTLRQSKGLGGRKMTLVDAQGNFICRIDPNSSVDRSALEQYINRTAAFVGVLTETRTGLVLTVRSVRLR